MSPSNLNLSTTNTIKPNLYEALYNLLEEREDLEESFVEVEARHEQWRELFLRGKAELRQVNEKIDSLRRQIHTDSTKKTREEELEEVVGMGGAEAVLRWEGTE